MKQKIKEVREKFLSNNQIEDIRQNITLGVEERLKFLNEHRFFTKTAIKTRTKKKQENIKKVKARLEKGEYLD